MEFEKFPKMGRLARECVISEKIDGTNAQIFIPEDGGFFTGSRTRWITPQDDNAGFSRWAHEHKDELLKLGPGRHFGEWWGQGIQRKYGLKEKRFSLFNTIRWCRHDAQPQRIVTADPRIEKYQERIPACCYLVPVLYRGAFSVQVCYETINRLAEMGSFAAPGFTNPEGIVCFHTAAQVGFKMTIKNDDIPKGRLAA
ncbi:MAG: RNA ligase family protein [Desulfobacterales bacterium]|nr:RNA ligase family protein [Desulfobacterales bacterium]